VRKFPSYGVRQTARVLMLAATATVVVSAQGQSQRTIPIPERIAEMQHHFVDVTEVHEAIIRGDLAASLQPSARLSVLRSPAGMPESSTPFVEAIRQAGRRLVQVPTLTDASVEVASMLSQCGACHRSMTVFSTPQARSTPDVGGIVGHMLEHQRALDDLLIGLVVPSDGRWREGAARLETAALRPIDWPADRQLTPEIRRAEQTVHNLAQDAARASTAEERGRVYAQLLLTCGSCHGLHSRIWGPRSQ
jgi:cytochrome c553